MVQDGLLVELQDPESTTPHQQTVDEPTGDGDVENYKSDV